MVFANFLSEKDLYISHLSYRNDVSASILTLVRA